MLATFLGLYFDGGVDATGIATVLLAIATAGLAVYTRMSVKQGALKLAQSQRPVLVPLRGGHSKPALKDGQFLLPVVNVGVGPAMTIRAELEFGDYMATRQLRHRYRPRPRARRSAPMGRHISPSRTLP